MSASEFFDMELKPNLQPGTGAAPDKKGNQG